MAEQKQTPLVQFVALLEIRIILKNEPNRCILQEVIAKIRYRTNWPQKRDNTTFRAKIDLLNDIKWGVKYIWGQFPLQMEFNGPICEVKVMNFNISHVETWNVPVTYWSKWPYVSWPISRKRLKETKRYLQGFKYGSSWVQINKQIENRFTLRGDIPISRYRTKWPKWPISVPVSVL